MCLFGLIAPFRPFGCFAIPDEIEEGEQVDAACSPAPCPHLPESKGRPGRPSWRVACSWRILLQFYSMGALSGAQASAGTLSTGNKVTELFRGGAEALSYVLAQVPFSSSLQLVLRVLLKST